MQLPLDNKTQMEYGKRENLENSKYIMFYWIYSAIIFRDIWKENQYGNGKIVIVR